MDLLDPGDLVYVTLESLPEFDSDPGYREGTKRPDWWPRYGYEFFHGDVGLVIEHGGNPAIQQNMRRHIVLVNGRVQGFGRKWLKLVRKYDGE